MEELIKKVQEWANNKGLNKPEQAESQLLKLIEEYGETCGAILKRPKQGDKPLIDGFGDMVVVVIIFALMTNKEFKTSGDYFTARSSIIRHVHAGIDNLLISIDREGQSGQSLISNFIDSLYVWIKSFGFTPEQCLAAAYDEIKGRTGTLVNGTFIKDEVKETPQVVDLSTLEKGDSVEYRHGDIDKVISCYIEDNGKYKIVTETDIDVYNKNGNWLESKLSKFDIVRIIKA